MATIRIKQSDGRVSYYSHESSLIEALLHSHLLGLIREHFPIKCRYLKILGESDLEVTLGCFANLQKTLFVNQADSFEVHLSDIMEGWLARAPARKRKQFDQFVSDLKNATPNLVKRGGVLWRTGCKDPVYFKDLRTRSPEQLSQTLRNLKLSLPRAIIDDAGIKLHLVRPFYDINLFEWDMHHASTFSEADELVYFSVKRTDVYVACVGRHEQIDDDETIRCIVRNWPHLRTVLNNPTVVDPKLSPMERKCIRGGGNRYVTTSVVIPERGIVLPHNGFDVSLTLPTRIRNELIKLRDETRDLGKLDSQQARWLGDRFTQRVCQILFDW